MEQKIEELRTKIEKDEARNFEYLKRQFMTEENFDAS